MEPAELLEAARRAREHAYAPYSGYLVGAAVLTADGKVITGCNVENASYGATICAERVALTAAVAQGHRAFVALALVTENGGAPCGLCRQVMAELAPEMKVYIGVARGGHTETTVAELLPHAFGPAALASPEDQR
jgi:cytidine deaminase